MAAALRERAVREAFREADTTGEGIIPKAGFEALLRALGLNDERALASALDVALDSSRQAVNYTRFLDWAFSAEEKQAVAAPKAAAAAAAAAPSGARAKGVRLLRKSLRNGEVASIIDRAEASQPQPPSPTASKPEEAALAGPPKPEEAALAGPEKTDQLSRAMASLEADGARPAADGPVSPTWRTILDLAFGTEPTEISDTAERGITLRQLRLVLSFCERFCGQWRDTSPAKASSTVGEQLDMGSLNLYHVNDWVVKPATVQRPCGSSHSCAFVELLATGPQRPLWYVSHWWGEPIRQFSRCLELQGAQRALGDDAPFWVCAYANRQHDLGQELTKDPTQSSFFRAMQMCRGVLLVVDSPSEQKAPATVFRRIWVQFEEAMTFRLAEKGDFLFDIATVHRGEPQLLADGCTVLDQSRKVLATPKKTNRERAFPIEIIEAALRVTMGEAVASREEDRRHILNSIAGLALDASPPESHDAFERTDQQLHALFAQAAWPQAAAKGLVGQMGLPDALAADVWRTRLSLDLSRCAALTDTADLARGLRGLSALASLSLFLGCCRKLASIDDVSESLAGLTSLTDLDLHLGCCDQLRSVDRLGASLGTIKSLRRVALHLEGCSAVVDFSELWHGLSQLPSLECLQLYLHGCTGARNIGDIGPVLAEKPELEVLTLVLAGCTQLTTLADLGQKLSCLTRLRTLKLNLSACERLSSADELGAGLLGVRGSALELLHLGFSHCTGLVSLAAVARAIGELGAGLRSLSLWLKGCTRLASGASELARALPALTGLDSLELCLADCCALPSSEVAALARAVAGLPSPPARFELDLCGCAVPERRLGRRFASHAEFREEVAAAFPSGGAGRDEGGTL